MRCLIRSQKLTLVFVFSFSAAACSDGTPVGSLGAPGALATGSAGTTGSSGSTSTLPTVVAGPTAGAGNVGTATGMPTTGSGGQAGVPGGGSTATGSAGATAAGGMGAAGSAMGGSTSTAGQDPGPIGGRGPTAPSATAQYPFPQNRESSNCSYPLRYDNDAIRALYEKWKSDLVTSDGAGGFRRVARVAEPGLQPNSTVSEGIAYGMLISVYMDDQPLFDDLWKYALQYRWTSMGTFGGGGEATLLMNWYIHADGNISGGGGDDPAGNGAATDADEDIAFALVMADRQWGGGGSLDRSYIDYATELIDDIWAFEIADERLPKNGSSWGDDGNLNISYFAPAYYKVFAKVTGDNRWSSNVVDYIYQVIDQNLKPENGNESNGLVPAWSTSGGDPAQVGPGQGGMAFHYQYDSCRTPFRIGQDACWNGDQRAKDYVAKTSSFFAPKGPAGIVDGYELNGTDRPEFPDSFGGLSGAFIGPASVGAMHDAQFQGFLDESYALLMQNNAWAGGQYYDESWIMLSALMLSGNFLDYTLFD